MAFVRCRPVCGRTDGDCRTVRVAARGCVDCLRRFFFAMPGDNGPLAPEACDDGGSIGDEVNAASF